MKKNNEDVSYSVQLCWAYHDLLLLMQECIFLLSFWDNKHVKINVWEILLVEARNVTTQAGR